MLERHLELKTELTNKEEKFQALQDLGRRVVPSAKNPEEIRERMKQLSQEILSLKELWEKRNKLLKQSSELQVHVLYVVNCNIIIVNHIQCIIIKYVLKMKEHVKIAEKY